MSWHGHCLSIFTLLFTNIDFDFSWLQLISEEGNGDDEGKANNGDNDCNSDRSVHVGAELSKSLCVGM